MESLTKSFTWWPNTVYRQCCQ